MNWICILLSAGLILEEEEAGVCRVEGSEVYFADCLANSLHDMDFIKALLGFIDRGREPSSVSDHVPSCLGNYAPKISGELELMSPGSKQG